MRLFTFIIFVIFGFLLARETSKKYEMEEKLEALHKWAHSLNKAEGIDKIIKYTLDAMEKTLIHP